MNIAMFTMGTRGDVQPYIYLSRALIHRGHKAVIGTHPCWKKLVEDAGVEFLPVGPDIDIEAETAAIRGKSKNPLVSMLKTMNFVFRIIRNSTSEIYEGCKGRDMIVVTHSQMGAAEAEALGIPAVNVTLQTEMIPRKLKKPTFGEKLFAAFIGKKMVKPYNEIRAVYKLPKLRSSEELYTGAINLIPISEHTKERNPYWDDTNIMTGYWYEDEPYDPLAELREFIEAGEPPIILALGAMSFEDKAETEKLDMFVKAFERTGKRAVIQGFAKALEGYKLPDNMTACGSVPHSWLFRHGYAVIHHCGFGTSKTAMIYGIPSIPVPHVLDQIAFADQLHKLGVATEIIKAGELNEQRVIEAIKELDSRYDEFKRNAAELSEKLRAEDGLGRAVSLIEKAAARE